MAARRKGLSKGGKPTAGGADCGSREVAKGVLMRRLKWNRHGHEALKILGWAGDMGDGDNARDLS